MRPACALLGRHLGHRSDRLGLRLGRHLGPLGHRVGLLLSLFLGLLFVPSAARASERVAILVGNNAGGPGKPLLRFAEQDAKRMAELFTDLGSVEDVRLLLGKSAADVRATLREVGAAARMSEPALVVFFYSGHADNRALLLGDSRLEYADLREALVQLPARVAIAFVDACQSGRITRTKGGKAVPVVDVRFEDNPSYRGRVFVTSSAAGESSQEGDEIEASYFTYYLLAALRGAADLSGDRLVSLEEAYRYVYKQTVARTSETVAGVQHPTYDVDVTGYGELVLTRLTTRHSYVVLPKEAAGTFYVRSQETGTLVAELAKEAGEILRLALPAGRYEITHPEADALLAREVTTVAGSDVALDLGSMTRRKLAATARKGENELATEVETPPAGHHLLALSYSTRSGYLDDAGLLHGIGTSYDWDGGVYRLGVGFAWGRDAYRRDDGIDVTLDDLTLSLRAGATARLAAWARALAALELGPVWVSQRGALPGGDVQAKSSVAFAYRGRLGLEVDLRPLILSATGSAGQVVYQRSDGTAAQWVAGFEACLGTRF